MRGNMTTKIVGTRSLEEQEQLLRNGCTFTFTATDDMQDRLKYDIHEYSEDRDVVLFVTFIKTDVQKEWSVFEGTYASLAALLASNPFVDLSKFSIVEDQG